MWKEMGAEMALYHVIAYGVFFLVLFASREDAVAMWVVVLLSLLYGALAYILVKPAAAGENAVQRVGMRRIGLGLLVSGIATVAALAYAPLQLFAFFLALDALLALLPGKHLMVGKEVWALSPAAFVAIALVGLFLLLLNGLRIPATAVLPALVAGSAGVALLLAVGLVALIVLGMLGYRR